MVLKFGALFYAAPEDLVMLMACRLALVFVATLAFNASVAAQQSQQVFSLPAGAYPHDVAPAPDGKVWYSAQRNGALGILGPGDRTEP